MAEYGAFGIRFYWLIDPQRRSVEIFERGASGTYALRLKAERGAIEAVPGCPGLRLDVDAMWAKIDALDG